MTPTQLSEARRKLGLTLSEMALMLSRFQKHISPCPNTGCWFWSAGCYTNGYGMFWRNGGFSYAHRTAYELMRGPIINRLHVLHRCDTPGCVNPSHLFLGTNSDNIADRVRKGRSSHAGGSPPGGHSGKITPAIVGTIRARFLAGESQRAIAHSYGMSRTTVSKIVHRETWNHII